jgi:competence protein ComEA
VRARASRDGAEGAGDQTTGDAAVGQRQLRGPHVAVVAVLAVLALGLTVLVLAASQPRATSVPLAATPTPSAIPSAGPTPPASPGPAPTPTPTPTPAADLVVHVAGAVTRPGVVVLPAGSRVVDAVDAAGGALPGTALDSVNLARLLVDGEQVRVGLPADPAVASPGGPDAASAAGGPTGGEGSGVAPVDLNAATAADLDALPGIGPVLAQRIVDWRAQNGRFGSVEELLEVAGIGPSVLADLQGRVTV